MLLRDFVQTSNCSTAPIAGLVKQVFAKLTSDLPPDTLVDISAHIEISGASKLPFVQRVGAEALIDAIEEKGEKLPLVHAFRVLPHQFVLRTWAEQQRCDITRAAPPSKSNHEGANAIDVPHEVREDWKPVLNDHGWFQTVLPDDPAHFDFTGEHDPDFVEKAVLAFQRLWNTHNPDDLIKEDGLYGPKTEKRLKKSPIAGF
ncbi:MAG TPA: M15 family metallopeptidase [Pyrinomonadaceae bacterium]|nr:M15 family metallopeptidase [Pyrinomonadaceae bacterium]